MPFFPLILATRSGLVVVEYDQDAWKPKHTSLSGKNVTAVIARDGVIIAGTTDGLFRSSDLGLSWFKINKGLSIRHVRWLAFNPEISDLEFAGTEPAGIFVSHDAGDHWQSRPEVEALRDQFKWWLPYSPEAGCVRGFAFHGSRVYAAVEVGGFLRSDDMGKHWRLADGSDGKPVFQEPPAGFIHCDVHSVEAHKNSPDLVFGATNSGLYRTRDGGTTWKRINNHGYTRAVWIDPEDEKHILSGPAEGVSRKGTIERSTDGGETWQDSTDGLLTPWPRAMVERFVQVEDGLFIVLSNGEVFVSMIPKFEWKAVLPEILGVNALTMMKH